MKKYISLNIYKPHYGDCSNGGLSSKYNECYIESKDGWIDEDRVPQDAIVKLVRGAFGTVHLEPVNPVPTNHVGYMMGGCYVGCSDFRWSCLLDKMQLGMTHCAIALHDRTESYEDYEMMSR